jgi:hypothetical protein
MVDSAVSHDVLLRMHGFVCVLALAAFAVFVLNQ